MTEVGPDKHTHSLAPVVTESITPGGVVISVATSGPGYIPPPEMPHLISPMRLGRRPSFDTAAESEIHQALDDIQAGVRDWRLWTMMGWLDIKQRYRRSTLGPFWLVLSMAMTVGMLGALYGTMFGMDTKTYLPFVCLGIISWELISKTLIDACNRFLELEHLIKQIRLPLTVHIAAMVWRHVIILAHNIVIYAVVVLVFSAWPGTDSLLIIPGLVVIIGNLIWMSLLLALVSARFRDVPQIVAMVVQMLFFATPIFWKPEMLKGLAFVVYLNPLYYLIELVRAPLLGSTATALSWIVAGALLVLGWGATCLIFARFRKRVAYWL